MFDLDFSSIFILGFVKLDSISYLVSYYILTRPYSNYKKKKLKIKIN